MGKREIKGCVIGNNTICQAKSICHCEKEGEEEEEKWRCLVRENVLFSNNGILGTQSISLGPVGDVFLFQKAGDKINHDLLLDLPLQCLSCTCPQSTSTIRKGQTHIVTLCQKEHRLMFGRPLISLVEHFERCIVCILNAPLI